MADALQKPILFLDFDRTLFDTPQFRAWLGEEHIEAHIEEVARGERALPDLRTMFYADTVPFLTHARKKFRLVLLSAAANVVFQKKKIDGSGIALYFDDVLITQSVPGNSGKGEAAQAYLMKHGHSGEGDVFVDDLLENISEMKRFIPVIRSIQIDRGVPKGGSRLTEGLLPPDDKVTSLTELLGRL